MQRFWYTYAYVSSPDEKVNEFFFIISPCSRIEGIQLECNELQKNLLNLALDSFSDAASVSEAQCKLVLRG